MKTINVHSLQNAVKSAMLILNEFPSRTLYLAVDREGTVTTVNSKEEGSYGYILDTVTYEEPKEELKEPAPTLNEVTNELVAAFYEEYSTKFEKVQLDYVEQLNGKLIEAGIADTWFSTQTLLDYWKDGYSTVEAAKEIISDFEAKKDQIPSIL